MADEFQIGSGNWWDTTSRNRFDGGATVPASVSTTLNTIAGFGLGHDQSSGGGDGGVGGVGLANPNMQMMGLGLSTQSMDWNQALLGEKGGNSFRSMLEEDMSSNSRNFQSPPAAAAQELWRQKLYSGGGSPDQDSSVDEFKQINRLFCSQASSNDSTITSNNLTTGFPAADSGAAYGLLLPENQHHHHSAYENRPMNYQYPPSGGYCGGAELLPTWNKFQPFSRSTSPPKQPPPSAAAALHFTNNTPFWNASPPPPAAMTDARSSFFTGLQTQIPASPCFDEKPKTTSESRDLSTATLKKSSTETSNKRPRNETPSPLPAFKVRKEKMGDRITALQQLVSPFGKTDTASVLSEAIEYIKFLHEQVSVLSTPYMKNGAPIQQINSDKLKDPAEGGRQDLRSRGLCLVPVSSTFPVTHETTVDFWTPTFGGSFR